MFIPNFKNQVIYNKKKRQTFKSRKISTRLSKLKYGNYGVGSQSYSLITLGQLESIRRFISRRVNKKNKKFIRISLTHRLFKKSNKSRMGKGVGKFYRWYGYIKPGQIIFEFNSEYSSKFLFLKFNNLKKKTPFKCFLLHLNIKFKLFVF